MEKRTGTRMEHEQWRKKWWKQQQQQQTEWYKKICAVTSVFVSRWRCRYVANTDIYYKCTVCWVCECVCVFYSKSICVSMVFFRFGFFSTLDVCSFATIVMFFFPYLSIILCVRVCNCVPFITTFICLVSTQSYAIAIAIVHVVRCLKNEIYDNFMEGIFFVCCILSFDIIFIINANTLRSIWLFFCRYKDPVFHSVYKFYRLNKV